MHTSHRTSARAPREPILTIAGRYACTDVLGQGATARVYRAWDKVLKIERAVKVLTAPAHARAPLAQRLQTEARLMVRLAHPHVLRVFDIGTDGDLDFVVMAVADESLQAHLDRHGPLPVAQAGRWMLQILSALQAAHAAGVVHRDVKPQNILLDGGKALLADFGIARADWSERQTRTNAALGSLAYMAPEQRIDAHNVGPQADLYAAAASFYVLITAGNPIDLFAAPLASPRWLILPDALAGVLRQAMAYDPAARFASADEMASALSAALALGGDVLGPPLPTLDDDDETVPEAVLYTEVRTPTVPDSQPLTSNWRALGGTLSALLLGLSVWLPIAGRSPQPVAPVPVPERSLQESPVGHLIPAWRRTPPATQPSPAPDVVSRAPLAEPAGGAVEGKLVPPEAAVPVPIPVLGPGTWEGTMGGEPVVLTLDVQGWRQKRTGTLVMPDGRSVSIRASFDPEQMSVTLDGPRRSRGALTMAADQREMRGTWRDGDAAPELRLERR